ncbi:hypothetical protein HPT25_28140 [Bacillus sp. BRMEA1]|uniref:hypothetical protein n=1 Tax=Neobacillus endophyticus TaxID=2738405 RepID=UPI001567B55F|nr:hypothetical protein [Neobacillus endophyticus]NRD81166.1 hypothetical protein [Neobacillus endophyticus]
MREIATHFTKRDNGVYLFHDTVATLNKNEVVQNVINGLDNGLVVTGFGSVDGIVIQNCKVAILNSYGAAVGNLFVSNCPILVKGFSGSRTGKIYSATEPTTILQYTGNAGELGTTLEGFNFPKNPITTTASSNNIINLFTIPTRLAGRLSIQNNDGANMMSYLVDLSYNGTDLTTTDEIKVLGGAINIASLSVANGQLALTCNTSSSITLNLVLDFQGEFYQA